MTAYEKKVFWIFPLVIAGLSFLFFQLFYPYHLFLKEQIRLFLYTPDYFLSYFNKPAWLASYIGDFLTQFFYLRGGAAILSLIFVLEWLLGAMVLRNLLPSGKVFVWALLLVIADWILHCDTLHSVAVSIGFILTLALFLVYTIASNRWLALISGVVFALIGYWLAGSSFLIFPILVLALDLKKGKVRLPEWLLNGVIVFSIPLASRHHFLLTPIQAFIFPAFNVRSALLPGAFIVALSSVLFLEKIEIRYSRFTNILIPFTFISLLIAGIMTTANFNFEKILSLDGETYFGNTDRVIGLSKQYNLKNKQATYFTNIALARKGVLPEYLLDFYQPFSNGLIPPVTPEESWQSIFVSNEVFFLIGDMNMAQHSAMLGNTFSPYQRSSRMMRRLAEINLVNGDSAAATKYLRILSKTLFHREWADSQLKMIQSSESNNWLTSKRRLLPNSDILRKSNDYLSSLQFLVEQHSDNAVAVDYLLCYLLLNKDLKSFRENYDRYCLKINRPVPKVYAEALLAQLVTDGASQQEALSYSINPETVKWFAEYTRIFEQTSGDINALNKQFAKSYWFYYHFATIQKK